MSVTPVKGRDGWFDVVVYDRVTVRGQKPGKISRRIKGERAAKQAETDLLAERKRGSLVARRQTVSDYAERYLRSRRAEVSPATLTSYENLVSRYIDRHEIGATPIGDVDPSAVRRFYADVLEHGSRNAPVGVETVSGVRRVLSMILKAAVHDGLLRTNPCELAKLPKDNRAADERREPGVDPVIAAEWIERVDGSSMYAISMVALGSGLRISELLALRWQDVDPEAGELQVTGKIEQVKGSVGRTAPKTQRSWRTVPVGATVVATLKEQRSRLAAIKLQVQKELVDRRRDLLGRGYKVPRSLWVDEGWAFPSLTVSFTEDGKVLPAGRIWTPSAFSQDWRRARDRVNSVRLAEFVLEREPIDAEDKLAAALAAFEPWEFGIHALRHAYGTNLLANGVRLEVVSRRLGHSSSIVTAGIYSHVLESEKRAGADESDSLLAPAAARRLRPVN